MLTRRLRVNYYEFRRDVEAENSGESDDELDDEDQDMADSSVSN